MIGEDDYIARANVERFKRLLEAGPDPATREAIMRLLEEAEAAVADSRERSGSTPAPPV